MAVLAGQHLGSIGVSGTQGSTTVDQGATLIQGQYAIFLGDASGNVYQWPSGFTHDGTPYDSVAQLAWQIPNEGQSRFYWLDMVTDRTDAKDSFKLYAATSDAPDQQVTPKQLTLQNIPNPKGQSGFTVRASLNADGVATGKFITVWIVFPNDNQDAAVSRIVLASRPLNAGLV